jgi:hypothetical protein
MDWLFLTREMAVLPLVKRDRWREFLSLFVCLFILPQQLATSSGDFKMNFANFRRTALTVHRPFSRRLCKLRAVII